MQKLLARLNRLSPLMMALFLAVAIVQLAVQLGVSLRAIDAGLAGFGWGWSALALAAWTVAAIGLHYQAAEKRIS